MSELFSMVIEVQPGAEVSVPAHLGRAVYAQMLRWLDAADATLARRWHNTDGPKPLTCSTLVGGKRSGPNQRTLTPEATYWLRLTGLETEVSAVLQAVAAEPPPTIELDGIVLPVTAVHSSGHDWVGTTSYNALAEPYLLARQKAPRRVALRFVAPVSFRQNGQDIALPLPDLVFGSLVDRWNAFSPVALSPEIRTYCQTAVMLNSFDLRSRGIPMKAGAVQIGAVGEAQYVAQRYDRYWMGLLGLLADFAFYSGVGRLTTAGLGQARRIR